MKVKLDAVITGMLVMCAVITTCAMLRREFMAPPTALASSEQKPVHIKEWRSDLSTGVQIGSEGAPVQVIEFADFECTYCGTFHRMLKTLPGRGPRTGFAHLRALSDSGPSIRAPGRAS
jgi:hypothetical protein